MSNIGIDIVEFEEIKERLSDRFIHRILGDTELKRYKEIKNPERRISFLAGRWAAKEAYTKVYTTFDSPLNFKDVEVLNEESGAPYIVSKYRPEDIIKVSISHSRNYAVAICMKE